MSLVQEYLKTHTLLELEATFHIFVNYHKTLPLAILNYHPTKSKRFDPLIEECRGLVIDILTNEIIASGMPRFYNYAELIGNNIPYEFHEGMRCEHKEDGTLLHMFYYKKSNEWLLANRYNFCDDIVNQALSDMTYLELFESICNTKLQDLGKGLDRDVTYCLEMCSMHNAIIKLYHKPKVFLLCSFKNLQELPYENPLECWEIPNHFIVNSLAEIKKLLDENPDTAFEGFVIINKHNHRVKLKTKLYRIIHSLKYRGWPAMSYDNAMYLHNLTLIDQVLGLIGYYRNEFDIKEMQHRIKMFLTHGRDYKFIDVNHPNKYCELKVIPTTTDEQNNGIAVSKPYQNENKNTFRSWIVTCYCGANPMPLRRLKFDFPMYRTCHCGSRFDIKTYHTDTYLYICDKCNLTHEAYQNTMTLDSGDILPCYQPTGIPASDKCKNIRLHVHQLIDELVKQHNYTKNQAYELIATILNKKRSEAHVGKFDILTCYELIGKLQDHIKKLGNNKLNKS